MSQISAAFRYLVAGAVVLTVCLPASAAETPEARASATCSDYSNQRDAQLNKDTRDADGDGIYCEALPCPCLKPGDDAGGGGGGGGGSGDDGPKGNGCTRPRGTITVDLSRSRYPESTLHFEVAWRQGAPRRYTIARNRADRNRNAWDDLVPVGVDADGDGNTDDRDEVPMAFTREGGRKASNGESASNIAYVNASDNRGAGSYIGGKLRPYCNGTHFRVKLVGTRTRKAKIVVALRNGKEVDQTVSRGAAP